MINFFTKNLFIEGYQGHSYLFDLYDKIPNSQLMTLPIDFWSQGNDLYHILKSNYLMPTIENYIFLTIDPLIYSNNNSMFFENMIKLKKIINISGFLHRLPLGYHQIRQLKDRAIFFKNIFVFSEYMEKFLTNNYNLNNVIYIPHHPTHSKFIGFDKNKIKTKLNINHYKKIFTVIGDIRDGKGIELLVKSWKHIHQKDLTEMLFILAGRSIDNITSFIKKNKEVYNVNCLIDIRKSRNPLNLEVLLDNEFGNYITISDVGLFLYHGDQRMGMSGVLPNFIFNDLPVLGTENSIVGKYIKNNSLGEILSMKKENSRELAKLLVNIKNNSYKTKYHLGEGFKIQKQKMKPNNILAILKKKLC